MTPNELSSQDIVVLSMYKVELQRINDLRLQVDHSVIEFIKNRINNIESPPPETERVLIS